MIKKHLRVLTKHAPLFLRINNHTLKGCYYITLGNRLENLAESRNHSDYIDRALIEYAAASYHFELSDIVRTLRTSKPISVFSTSRSIDSMKRMNTWIVRVAFM